MRTRAERRKNNFNHINKKKKLVHSLMGSDWYEHDGQYSKGKIHCSCPICTGKKNGRRSNSDKDKKISDKRKLDSMKYSVTSLQDNSFEINYNDLSTYNDYEDTIYQNFEIT